MGRNACLTIVAIFVLILPGCSLPLGFLAANQASDPFLAEQAPHHDADVIACGHASVSEEFVEHTTAKVPPVEEERCGRSLQMNQRTETDSNSSSETRGAVAGY